MYKRAAIFIYLLSVCLCSCMQRYEKRLITLPVADILSDGIVMTDSLDNQMYPFLHDNQNAIQLERVNEELYHLTVTINPDSVMVLKNFEIQLRFLPDSSGIWDDVKSSFHWMPNMKHNDDRIISQHVFRSPAIILSYKKAALSLIPDLNMMASNPIAPYYMDIQYKKNGIFLKYGLSHYSTTEHVYYKKTDSAFRLSRKLEMGLFLICSEKATPLSILKSTNSFLWNSIGKKYQDSILPQVLPFKDYAAKGYSMALDKYWVNGYAPNSGGITLSTFYDNKNNQYRGRYSKNDIWFHSWFNNMRTAYGLFYWGKATGNDEWCQKAQSIINLFLSCPKNEGFFPVIWIPEKNQWEKSSHGGGKDMYHVPDNVWTAYWLMRYNDELNPVTGCDTILMNLTDKLLCTQNSDGSFPARIHTGTLIPDTVLCSSASGAISTWFLEELLIRKELESGRREKVIRSVKRSLEFLEEKVLPLQRFEDFEVYFSCSPKPLNDYDSSTCMYPQNTLSIQWCAEAFLKAYLIFKDSRYLRDGEYCLNILSLYQQVWNPPYISLYAFGGFGTQNSDAEWSDARQAQFAETYLNYYSATSNMEYLQRAVYACRASFTLMAIPENKYVAPLNYQGHHFNSEYTGCMAENFGHDGINKRSFQSGFHWGTGSALTTAAIFKKELGDIFLDPESGTATGIDGIVVNKAEWGTDIKLSITRLNISDPFIIHTRNNKQLTRKLFINGKDSGIGL